MSHGTHAFLLKDFLQKFEYEPDADNVRAKETAAVHGSIQKLQAELIEAQTDPSILAKVVEDELAESTKAERESTGPAGALIAYDHAMQQELSQLATGSIASAIGSGITAEKVEAMKAVAKREHQVATIQARWIQGKSTEISQVIRKLTPFFEEKAAASLARTEDIQAYVAKLIEGIASLDLYVGKAVEVQSIRSGKSADPTEPLSFVQKKLLVDEELAIWADVDEEFDFTKEALFFDALRNHDNLVDQIFPTTRCVLVMATTRRNIDYGDRWTNNAKNEENRKVFLMVRNGENIHRVFSPVESHLGANRLFPSKDDQDRIFRGVDGSEIKFEDVAYTTHLASHAKYALHYKRFLLLMCGLDHREKLFGDFYDGIPSLDFVTQAFQDQYCRFLHDEDGAGLLEGNRRLPVRQWIEEKNAYLSSGSRVLCHWEQLMNPSTAPSACESGHTSDNYHLKYLPANTIDLKIVARNGEHLCVKVDVSSRYGRGRRFQCNVKLTEIANSYRSASGMPYLCLDTVEPEELLWYLHNRESRTDHLHYIRFFKLAYKHLVLERSSEADSRGRMLKALAGGSIAQGEDARQIVNQTVIAWRAANRGKALPSFVDGNTPPAWKALLDQMYILAGQGKRQSLEMESFARQLGYRPLRTTLTGNGKHVIYAAPRDEELDARLEPHAWVHRLVVERKQTQYVELSRRWTSLRAVDATESTLQDWPESKDWIRSSGFKSHDSKQELLSEVLGYSDTLQALCRIPDTTQHRQMFEDWISLRQDESSRTGSVGTPDFLVPIGAFTFSGNDGLNYIALGKSNPYGWLYQHAPDDQVRAEMRQRFIRNYEDKAYANEFHDQLVEAENSWYLAHMSNTYCKDERKPFTNAFRRAIRVSSPGGPRLTPAYNHWRSRDGRHARVWLADGWLDETGELALDALLGISLPPNYDPREVIEVTASSHDNSPIAFRRWFEIAPLGTKATSINRNAPGASQYTFSYSQCASPGEAYELIKRKARKAGVTIKPANEVEGAPPPNIGCERWMVIEN